MPLACEQRLSLPFKKGESHLMPAITMVGHPITKKPQIAAVTPATDPCINRLSPSFSSNVTVHNWKERGKGYLCSRLSYQLSQGPQVSFDHPWTIINTHMEDQ